MHCANYGPTVVLARFSIKLLRNIFFGNHIYDSMSICNYILTWKRLNAMGLILWRDGRVVEGGGLENRWAKAPWVRILLTPPVTSLCDVTKCQPCPDLSGPRRDGRAGWRRSPAKRVWGETSIEGSNPSLSATLKTTPDPQPDRVLFFYR